MFEYNAHILRVVDGDTLHVLVDLGLDIQQRITLRLAGVNTPEMSTTDGPIAKQFTVDWLINQRPSDIAMMAQTPIRVRTIKDKKEKYGRYLAVVWPYDATHTTESTTTVGSLNSNLIAQGWTY